MLEIWNKKIPRIKQICDAFVDRLVRREERLGKRPSFEFFTIGTEFT